MAKRALIRIESMAFKGYGVSRMDGKVVFIPYSAIGDEGWVEIVEEKKTYSTGKLVEILVPSVSRVEPPCPYFGTCGGCQWQHIDYAQQAELKKEILKDILMRLGKLEEIPSITTLSSPDPYNYRIRVQLKVKGEKLGYYQERSHQLIDIERCPIAHPLVNEIIPLLRKERFLLSPTEEIDINVSPEEGKGVLIFRVLKTSQGWETPARRFLKSHPILKGITTLSESQTASFGKPDLSFTIPLDLTLRTSPRSFFQVNLKQNEKLIREVLEFSRGQKHERALDLYSGVGNFALPLATVIQKVWGIEESAVAVKDARFNAQFNGIENGEFIRGKVKDVLNRWKRERPDLILLDPPRAGCREAVDQVAGLKPKRIVYVSCEPTLLARDLRLFSNRGYFLRELALIDMFPQTYHMEVVALLTQAQKSQIPSSKSQTNPKFQFPKSNSFCLDG
jgi:23S rRNA (uracil1939-C5)-methyltransferase